MGAAPKAQRPYSLLTETPPRTAGLVTDVSNKRTVGLVTDVNNGRHAAGGVQPIPLPAGLSAAPDLTEVAVRAARQASSLKLTAGKGRQQAFFNPTPPKSLLGG